MGLCVLWLLLTHIFVCLAIFEDQAGVLDWFQQYAGKIKFLKLDPNNAASKTFFFGSEVNVIGSVNLRDGSIVWRQVLEENGQLKAMEYCDQKIFSLSYKNSMVLRSWDAKFGAILWESVLPSTISSSSTIWCNDSKKIIVVSYASNIIVLSMETGDKIWSNDANLSENIPDSVKVSSIEPYSTSSNSSLIILEHYLLGDQINSLFTVKLHTLSSSGRDYHITSVDLPKFTLNAATHVVSECDIMNSQQGVCLVCLLSGRNEAKSEIRFIPVLPNLSNWQTIPIDQKSPKLIKLTSDYFLLTSSSSSGSVYNLNSVGEPIMKYSVENVMIGCLGRLNNQRYLFTLYQHTNQPFKNLVLNIYELESGQLTKPNLGSHLLTLASHHGMIESMFVVMFIDANGAVSFRFLLQTQDHAVQLIKQNGKQHWVREEALANVVAVEVVDLPVSEFQAKMEEEFGHANYNILEMFLQRIKTQTAQFFVWFRHWIVELPRLFVTVITSPSLATSLFGQSNKNIRSRRSHHYHHHQNQPVDEFVAGYPMSYPPRLSFPIDINLNEENHTDSIDSAYDDSNKFVLGRNRGVWDEFLTRDLFNLHKMLIVATSAGKLFGLESERGRMVWEHLVPSSGILANGKLALFQQRNTAHFPLPPLMTLLSRSRITNLPILFSFNPITGVPATREIGVDLYELRSDILQAVLQPGPATEQSKFIRPILLLMKPSLEVSVYPPSSSSSLSLNSVDSLPLYIYTIENDQARLTGYRIQTISSDAQNEQAQLQNTTRYQATRVWRMSLGSDSNHVIVASASHPSSEHIHSVGRVLGDRSVLYKYLNPNLLAILTVGGHVNNQTNTVIIYLIDTVVGRIIHSAVHTRCTEPVSLVQSENWIIYSYYNHKSLRNEVTVLELYEPSDEGSCVSRFVPTPWQLFLDNLIPSSWLPSSHSKSSNIPSNQLDNFGTGSSSKFSSLFRATNENNLCQSYSLIPEILQQSYILTTSPRSNAVAVSMTERGITAKSIIFALQKNGLVEMPKTLFDPRRSLDLTPELIEEGVHPYAPVLPISDQAMLSYNQSVMRIRAIRTAPTGLESTGLVFAYGLDLFFTRIAPSQTFDLLKEDFDYTAIAMVTSGMILASIITNRLATRRAVLRAWQ